MLKIFFVLFLVRAFLAQPFLSVFHAPENIAFDVDTNTMLVSDIRGLYRVDPEKNVTKIYSGMVNGVAVKEGKVYFAPVTSVMVYDGKSFKVVSSGYRMANGLAICGDKLVVSDSGILDLFSSRIEIIDLSTYEKKIVIEKLWGANGVVCDKNNRGFYFSETFIGTIYHVNFSTPEKRTLIFSYRGKRGPYIIDDLTLGPDGFLYLADFLNGKILRINPEDGSYSTYVEGLHSPTTARFSPLKAFGYGCLYIAEKGPPAFFGKRISRVCR